VKAMKTLSEVKAIFSKEFSLLEDKFNLLVLDIDDALDNSTNEVNRPGVYVFWRPKDGVIKVGKSQSNSKKRALEHIRDNTHNADINMSSLPDEKEVKLLLFNIIDDKDLHWILSLGA